MYDYIIVTHIPNFYKVNLYNQLSKKFKILVIFIAGDTVEKRSSDFIALNNCKFEYRLLYEGNYESRNIKANIFGIRSILKDCKYKRILVSGWESKEYWYVVFTNPISKNCLALESTINESSVTGLKNFLKRLFLSRISIAFASGSLHKKLLEKLSYKGAIKITKGVGIINKPKRDYVKREYKKRYLFIGRLSKVKNIEMLVDLFNELEDYMLTIIGAGPLEHQLKRKAKKNIIFEGEISNKEIRKYIESNDVLMLTSISETWGLVVEEAIYYGMPVIVSSNCGVSELIHNDINGYVVDLSNTNLRDIIVNINDDTYNKLTMGVINSSLNTKDSEQVTSYDV